MPWTLDNAEDRAAEAPRSFFIPPKELRHALKKGDEVKLIFRLERDDGQVAVERMWVEVTQTKPYVGELRNTPELEVVIEFGDPVGFGPEHVCAYAYTEAELGYNVDDSCLIPRRLAEADTPPPLLHLNAQGEWEAQDQGDRNDDVLHWTLGYLTDRFPETTPALREGSKKRGIRRRPQRDVWWEWHGDRYLRR